LAALPPGRDGSWSTINKGGSPTVVNRRYPTMYVGHGTDPVNASYAYLLLPGAGVARTQARAADANRLTVLANSGSLQAFPCARSASPATLVSAATGATLTPAFGDLTGTAGAGQLVTVRLG
jgi:hypothetical protein